MLSKNDASFWNAFNIQKINKLKEFMGKFQKKIMFNV